MAMALDWDGTTTILNLACIAKFGQPGQTKI
jgi:hypothetical protein